MSIILPIAKFIDHLKTSIVEIDQQLNNIEFLFPNVILTIQKAPLWFKALTQYFVFIKASAIIWIKQKLIKLQMKTRMR